MTWKTVYLEEVEKWLAQCNTQQLKAIAKELKLLERCGNELTLPHRGSFRTSIAKKFEAKLD